MIVYTKNYIPLELINFDNNLFCLSMITWLKVNKAKTPEVYTSNLCKSQLILVENSLLSLSLVIRVKEKKSFIVYTSKFSNLPTPYLWSERAELILVENNP